MDKIRSDIAELRRSPDLDALLMGRLDRREVLDLLCEVAIAEPWSRSDQGLQGGGVVSDEARRAVTLMHLRGFQPEEVGPVLGIPVRLVVEHLRRQHNSRSARDVVSFSVEGLTPSEVARRTGVHRSTVYEILKRAGVQVPTASKPEHEKALRLRRSGASYTEIRQATGLSTNQLRKLFQRRKDSIPDYGYGPGGSQPPSPRTRHSRPTPPLDEASEM